MQNKRVLLSKRTGLLPRWVVNFYSAGVVIPDRRIGSCTRNIHFPPVFIEAFTTTTLALHVVRNVFTT
jgi:hypothetical protein